MVAAAARGYDLLVYQPTVDSDGFDLILDDRDRLLPLQLKSVVFGGRAAKWSIHRKLLRPERHEIEWFGFEPSPCGEGRGGGVLLAEVSTDGISVGLSYRYTDLRILTAFWLDLIPVLPQTKARLQRLRSELESQPSGKVALPKTAFVKAKSPEHLLALAGLHSRFENTWPNMLCRLARFEFERQGELPAPLEQTRIALQVDLGSLIDSR